MTVKEGSIRSALRYPALWAGAATAARIDPMVLLGPGAAGWPGR
jgi:hypothetical protein